MHRSADAHLLRHEHLLGDRVDFGQHDDSLPAERFILSFPIGLCLWAHDVHLARDAQVGCWASSEACSDLRACLSSVVNTVKRGVLIWLSVVIFGNPVTFLSGFGTLLVVAGVLLYNEGRKGDANSDAPMSDTPLLVAWRDT